MNSSIEYPSLKEAADDASQAVQRTFLMLNTAQLTILVLIAFLSGWGSVCIEIGKRINIAIAVLMFVALGITTILRIGKFDDRWFRCRALAENVKSAVWYFVMSSADSLESNEVVFLEEVDQLRKRLEPVAKEVALHDQDGNLVTTWMREAQKLPLDQKIILYRENRLENQRAWYLKKAQFNILNEKWWFGAIFIVEFFAVACAASVAALPNKCGWRDGCYERRLHRLDADEAFFRPWPQL